MDIEFRGQYSKDIYYKAIHWIYKPSRKSLIIRVVAFVIFTSLYIALIVMSVQEEGPSSYEASRMLRHFFTFAILGYVIFQPAITARRKANELWNDPIVHRVLTGRVSPLGVIIDPGKDWMSWESFIKINRSSDFIVLLTASRMFVLLQRSFFRDEQDWKMAQSLINSKVRPVIES